MGGSNVPLVLFVSWNVRPFHNKARTRGTLEPPTYCWRNIGRNFGRSTTAFGTGRAFGGRGPRRRQCVFGGRAWPCLRELRVPPRGDAVLRRMRLAFLRAPPSGPVHGEVRQIWEDACPDRGEGGARGSQRREARANAERTEKDGANARRTQKPERKRTKRGKKGRREALNCTSWRRVPPTAPQN